jgi:hypothetical protein
MGYRSSIERRRQPKQIKEAWDSEESQETIQKDEEKSRSRAFSVKKYISVDRELHWLDNVKILRKRTSWITLKQ